MIEVIKRYFSWRRKASPQHEILLFDRMRYGRVLAPAWVHPAAWPWLSSEVLRLIRAKLDQAERIEASAVCETFCTNPERQSFTEQERTALDIPFPMIWIEMKRPSRIIQPPEGIRSNSDFPRRMGFLFEKVPTETCKELLDAAHLPGCAKVDVQFAEQEALYGKAVREKERQCGSAAWYRFSKRERAYVLAERYYRQDRRIDGFLKHWPDTGSSWRIYLFGQLREQAVGPMGLWALLLTRDAKLIWHSRFQAAFATAEAIPDMDLMVQLDYMLNPALFAATQFCQHFRAGRIVDDAVCN